MESCPHHFPSGNQKRLWRDPAAEETRFPLFRKKRPDNRNAKAARLRLLRKQTHEKILILRGA
jgi:hypothetical protein